MLNGSDMLKGSGGWMIGALEALLKQGDNVKLSVATVSRDVKKLTRLEGKRVTYWLLPYGKGNVKVNHNYEPLWHTVRDAVNPDVVHLHGTEFSHGLAYIEACGVDNLCVSIQGLTSAISSCFFAGLTRTVIYNSWTPGTLCFGGIMKSYRELKNRKIGEIEILKRVNHVIGRTSWDRAHTRAVNPEAEYHYGGETLRPEFYTGDKWMYSECVPHTIFLSQANTPIKGLHMVLRALPIILRYYPDTIVRVAGRDITANATLKQWLMLSDYGNIIRKQIKKNRLEGKVVFVGPLEANGMKAEYLRSNVFVCPSAIENSPNSLGEAQMLGVPVIASFVGGIPDMMQGDVEHLYCFDDEKMLANKIVELFDKQGNIDMEPIRQNALKRHDPVINANELIEIYNKVKR